MSPTSLMPGARNLWREPGTQNTKTYLHFAKFLTRRNEKIANILKKKYIYFSTSLICKENLLASV